MGLENRCARRSGGGRVAQLLPKLLPIGPDRARCPDAEGPATRVSAGHGPFSTRRMGDSNPRGCYPNTLSKCLNGGWDVFAGVRFRRSARCADSSHGPWTGLDREELLPKLLPLRGRGTGGVEPGSRPALGQAVAALRPAESERKQ